MNTNDQIYRALQQHLDKGPVGFPATPSGVEVTLLKKLFTPLHAQIASHLSTIKLESPKTIHHRLQKNGVAMSLADLKSALDVMAYKGLILAYSEGFNEKHYKNAGMSAGGIIDFQVNRFTKDLMELFDQYHKEVFAGAENTGRRSIPQLRTVPVSTSIPTPEKHSVATYDDVRSLLDASPGPFAVANCMCRQTRDMQGTPCKYSDIRETCLQIGPDHARQYVDMGIARYVNKDEALGILEKAEKAGFILQPENSLKPEAICCCCGDCCMLLSTLKKAPKPALMYASNYYVTVDSAFCKACGECVKRCQLDARTLSLPFVKGDKEGFYNSSISPSPSTGEGWGVGESKGGNGMVSVVNLDRCIGCGNCVITCKTGATRLVKKDVALVPPRDKDAAFMKIMSAKVGRWNMLKLRLKMLLRMRV
jgi:NAD-dependent dihydropyrimidine dehydrogenase PreA subunit